MVEMTRSGDFDKRKRHWIVVACEVSIQEVNTRSVYILINICVVTTTPALIPALISSTKLGAECVEEHGKKRVY